MTEIFATLGPGCSDTETLSRMFRAGMSGVRLNLSHKSLKESADVIENYHRAMEQTGINGELLIDLRGGELRIGQLSGKLSDGTDLTEGCMLENSTYVHFVLAGSEGITVPKAVSEAIEEGDEILLDDGKLLLRAEKKDRFISARVIRGGRLYGKKSIKIVGKEIKAGVLTPMDREDILNCREFGVTALMQPFVTGAQELRELKTFLEENGIGDLRIFAKIENRKGIENLDEIIPEADMIVVARGDLGNDIPLWELPGAQKYISHKCRKQGKPFLIVTQMLSSMISSPVPTRAEVSDIYNAVSDGASAVMVTNETAVGSYPVEVVEYLKKTVDSFGSRKWQSEIS